MYAMSAGYINFVCLVSTDMHDSRMALILSP